MGGAERDTQLHPTSLRGNRVRLKLAADFFHPFSHVGEPSVRMAPRGDKAAAIVFDYNAEPSGRTLDFQNNLRWFAVPYGVMHELFCRKKSLVSCARGKREFGKFPGDFSAKSDVREFKMLLGKLADKIDEILHRIAGGVHGPDNLRELAGGLFGAFRDLVQRSGHLRVGRNVLLGAGADQRDGGKAGPSSS